MDVLNFYDAWLRYPRVCYFSGTILRKEVRFVRGFRESLIGQQRGIKRSKSDGGEGEHSKTWTAARDFQRIDCGDGFVVETAAWDSLFATWDC